MENTRNSEEQTGICCICKKQVTLLGIEDKINRNHNDQGGTYRDIGSELDREYFIHDIHLNCRIKLARYYEVGLKSRWQRRMDFRATSKNKKAVSLVNKIKKLPFKHRKSAGLYIYGPAGSGKTHLLVNLCCFLATENPKNYARTTFLNVPSMLTEMRSDFGKKYKSNEKTKQETIRTQLEKKTYLFLDDLGAESSTDWAKEVLYNAVNFRYEKRLPLYISSNLTPDKLAYRLGDRFTSRIMGMCESVELDDQDRRTSGKYKSSEREVLNQVIPCFTFRFARWKMREQLSDDEV